MPSAILHQQATRYQRTVPNIRSGQTVRVHERITEGDKQRVQVFEGLVIATHNGHTQSDRTITVRKVVSGIGVERVFALHSPLIERIEVKKVAKVRRSKLFHLRGRTGKAARLSERFTTAEEQGMIEAPTLAAEEPTPEEQTQSEEVAEPEAPVEEPAPVEESNDSEESKEAEEEKKD